VGYTFDITQPITITALGTIDFGGTSIATTGPRPVEIFYATVNTPLAGVSNGVHISGDPVPGASAVVTASDPIYALDGSPYTGGDGFRYHVLAQPITLTPVMNSYEFEIVTANLGTGFATNWVFSSSAPGVSGPVYGVFGNPTDSAIWGGALPDTYTPAAAGPNFLIGVPEPGVAGVVAAGLVMCRRSRRK